MIEGKIQWGLINENVFLADANINSNRHSLLHVAGHRGACSRFQLRPIMPSGTTAKNPLQERPEAGAKKATILKAIKDYSDVVGNFLFVWFCVFWYVGFLVVSGGGFLLLVMVSLVWFGLVL